MLILITIIIIIIHFKKIYKYTVQPWLSGPHYTNCKLIALLEYLSQAVYIIRVIQNSCVYKCMGIQSYVLWLYETQSPFLLVQILARCRLPLHLYLISISFSAFDDLPDSEEIYSMCDKYTPHDKMTQINNQPLWTNHLPSWSAMAFLQSLQDWLQG